MRMRIGSTVSVSLSRIASSFGFPAFRTISASSEKKIRASRMTTSRPRPWRVRASVIVSTSSS
jgi:hypothetical protein